LSSLLFTSPQITRGASCRPRRLKKGHSSLCVRRSGGVGFVWERDVLPRVLCIDATGLRLLSQSVLFHAATPETLSYVWMPPSGQRARCLGALGERAYHCMDATGLPRRRRRTRSISSTESRLARCAMRTCRRNLSALNRCDVVAVPDPAISEQRPQATPSWYSMPNRIRSLIDTPRIRRAARAARCISGVSRARTDSPTCLPRGRPGFRAVSFMQRILPQKAMNIHNMFSSQ